MGMAGRCHRHKNYELEDFDSGASLGDYLMKIVPDVLDKDKLLNWWWFDEAVADKVGDGIGDENGTLLGNASWSSMPSSTSVIFGERGFGRSWIGGR